MIQCDPWSTVGAMRAEIGVPLGAVILVFPGSRELDNEMQLEEIVREGLLTVEVQYRGVGGGDTEEEPLKGPATEGNVDEVRRLLAAGASVNATGAFVGRQHPLLSWDPADRSRQRGGV
mmetsp:Transcript_31743/g.74455  ORF Transcript_31743/g.74455 Transcript_31743/m.74455 type:complete len:119 (+) Transcript_31743:3-359(+)